MLGHHLDFLGRDLGIAFIRALGINPSSFTIRIDNAFAGHVNCGLSLEVEDMADVKILLDTDDLIRRYKSGETLKEIAETYNVCRPTIARRLRHAGIMLRTGGEARLLMWTKITNPVDRKAIVKKAHAAIRGKDQTEEHRVKIAWGRQMRGASDSSFENFIAETFRQRGFLPIHQFALGRYNLDIGLEEEAVAVEIFGGGWHHGGRAARRYRQRFDYILNRGWLPIVIWVGRTGISESCLNIFISI